ncbi:hypothetical protein CEXT_791981 [Caerostris extrusa]|uniref:Uncharacterized protein n=1 Tax=Caerostris extrusa TaxID=172846 RepID=A0AAV4VD01_CAEEX|nr:hypothetical protein CEXT_791981 [Caerostris extrusa]
MGEASLREYISGGGNGGHFFPFLLYEEESPSIEKEQNYHRFLSLSPLLTNFARIRGKDSMVPTLPQLNEMSPIILRGILLQAQSQLKNEEFIACPDLYLDLQNGED